MRGTLMKRENNTVCYRIKYTDGTEKIKNISPHSLKLLLEDDRKRKEAGAKNTAFIRGYAHA